MYERVRACMHACMHACMPMPYTSLHVIGRYSEMRDHKQEVAYNIGRAYHQLGLLHLAVPWYVQALARAPTSAAGASAGVGEGVEVGGEVGGEGGGNCGSVVAAQDVSREAAYNLARICETSGSDTLSRLLVRKYMTIE